jgi:hypothetical protein
MLTLSLALAAAMLGGRSTVHASASGAIPAWARRYNVNCTHCHAAAIPRLNSTGIRFKWSGYRMPEDIGQPVTVAQVSNYLAVRASIDYVWEKTSGEPTAASELADPAVQLFYAGPFGKNFGGWFELAREDGEVGSNAMVTGVWGSEKSHGGFRVGQVPYYLESGVAGFDRPIGLAAPTPADGPVTGSIPFALSGDQKAAELFYVTGSNRVAVQMLNAGIFDGEALNPTGSTKKDFGLTDQLLLDEKGSAIYAVGYYGAATALDSSQADATSHFWRVGLSASKVFGSSEGRNFEALGGVVYGRDFDLPVGAVYGSADQKGYGYWFSGQYFVGSPALTLFGRYEFLDPDTRTSSDGNHRFVAGAVLPVNLPEHLRLTAEYTLDKPQASGAPKTSTVTAEVQLIF